MAEWNYEMSKTYRLGHKGLIFIGTDDGINYCEFEIV